MSIDVRTINEQAKPYKGKPAAIWARQAILPNGDEVKLSESKSVSVKSSEARRALYVPVAFVMEHCNGALKSFLQHADCAEIVAMSDSDIKEAKRMSKVDMDKADFDRIEKDLKIKYPDVELGHISVMAFGEFRKVKGYAPTLV